MDTLERNKAIVMRDFLIEYLLDSNISGGFVEAALTNRAASWGLVRYDPNIAKYALSPAGHAYLKKHRDLR